MDDTYFLRFLSLFVEMLTAIIYAADENFTSFSQLDPEIN